MGFSASSVILKINVTQLLNLYQRKVYRKSKIETVELRQSLSDESQKQTDICSQVPNDYLPNVHSTHRWCYQKFTNISKILKLIHSPYDDVPRSKKRTLEYSSTSVLLPADQCLFCEEKRIVWQGKVEILVKCITKTAEESVKKSTEQKQDERILLKVRDIDLISREAHYHSSCRKAYTRDPERNKNQTVDTESINSQNVHNAAFQLIVHYVKESIIEGSNVERMSMKKEKYQQFMLENSPQFFNSSYKTNKLKAKLVKEFGSKLQFWQPNYKSELVYSTLLPKGQAVETAFEVATSDSKRLEEAAMVLRRLILEAQIESPSMSWPPSAAFLQSDAIHPPQGLQDFLTQVITGKKQQDISRQKEYLVNSFAQDILVMPKHLLLGISLRYLTGTAEIVTLFHRLGHSASYSCLLELETTMCKPIIDERQLVVPSTIHTEGNMVTHLCWDNFDLQEETLSGSGMTHIAHGLIIQETSKDNRTASTDIPQSQPRTKKHSTTCKPNEIYHCFAKCQSARSAKHDRCHLLR